MIQVNPQGSYEQHANWLNAHNENLSNALSEMDANPENGDQILNDYFNKEEELGTHFDYRQKGMSLEDSAINIAGQEIKAKDLDGDNKVSTFEYLAAELDEETVGDTELASSVIVYGMATIGHYDDNQDGKLSSDELADFYLDLDQYETNENGEMYKTEPDGKLSVDAYNGVANNDITSEINQVCSDLDAIEGYQKELKEYYSSGL